MKLQKEFYFVRHGQTDHNLLEGKHKADLKGDVPLNETGRNQAKLIQSIIANFPIKNVCSSPLKRAQETTAIITADLKINHYIIEELGECSALIWKEMTELGMYPPIPKVGLAKRYMDQVRKGTIQTLLFPNTSLIVSHGGVHWAICCLLGIHEHDWVINNCIPVHFSIGGNDRWIAKKLI